MYLFKRERIKDDLRGVSMDKMENIKGMLDTLIVTYKSEISIIEKMIINSKNTREVNKLLKEKAFWEGKLQVSEYVKLFTE